MPGTVVIVGAVLIHAGIGLRALFARRTLRLRPSEIAQLVLGLAIPYLLASYVIATRLLPEFHGVDVNFELVFAAYWISFPSLGIAQAVVLVVAWVHGCIGLHMWLRLKPWYPRLAPSALAIAVALPTLALAGYVAAGVEARALGGNEAWIDQLLATASYKPEMSDFVFANRDRFQIAFTIVVGAILLARYIRGRILVRQVAAKIHYRGRKTIDFKPGATLLEILWANGVPHASVCGGRGRCSTCRVRVGRGADWLDPPLEGEDIVLRRIAAPPGVRLACQIRPRVDLEVTPLLPPKATASDGFAKPVHLRGQECDVAIVFVDLRGSTKLSEDRLPYDFVFILNQFFAEIAAALKETGGHYAQFNGDGLMAIYGLETGRPGVRRRHPGRGKHVATHRRLERAPARRSGRRSENRRRDSWRRSDRRHHGAARPPHRLGHRRQRQHRRPPGGPDEDLRRAANRLRGGGAPCRNRPLPVPDGAGRGARPSRTPRCPRYRRTGSDSCGRNGRRVRRFGLPMSIRVERFVGNR